MIRIAVAVCLLLYSLVSAATSLTEQEQAWLGEKDRTFSIGMVSVPPYYFAGENSRVAGYSHDVLQLIAKQLDLQFRYRLYPSFAEVKTAVLSGELDVAAAINPSVKRRKNYEFTRPYLYIENRYFSKRGTQIDTNNLTGVKIGVSRGTLLSEWLIKNHPEAIVFEADTSKDLLKLLSNRSIDLIAGVSGSIEWNARQSSINDIEMAGDVVLDYQESFGTNKDKRQLIDILQKGLSGISTDQWRQLERRWLTGQDDSIWDQIRQLGIYLIIGMIFLGIMAVLVWNRSLQWQIKARRQAELAQRSRREMLEASSTMESRRRVSAMFSKMLEAELPETVCLHWTVQTSGQVILEGASGVQAAIKQKMAEQCQLKLKDIRQRPAKLISLIKASEDWAQFMDYCEQVHSPVRMLEPIVCRSRLIGFVSIHASVESSKSFEPGMTEQGKVSASVRFFELVMERFEDRRRLYEMAHQDSLTGLPNRRQLYEELTQMLSQGEVGALLFIDLDHFKMVNDSLGHEVGDLLLKAVASRFQCMLSEDQMLARLGGDEFVMVMPRCNGAQTEEMAQTLSTLMEDSVTVSGQEVYLSPSIGIALYPENGKNVDTLIRNADAAMYQAKDKGRNRWQFYDISMTVKARERLNLLGDLRLALARKDFELYYQPQHDMVSGNIIGAEALIRWNHQQLGFITPDKFIPLAEESGLILPLGEWVLETACNQMTRWKEKGIQLERISVNISMAQLHQPGLIARVEGVLERTACRPEWLEFEVTESYLMSDPVEAGRLLAQIRSMGIMVALDDFGTGYSSMSYLNALPLDRLKIDRSFVFKLPDEDEGAIVRAIIAMCQCLNIGIVAEGIEKKEQKQFMMEQGCDLAQGYLYSRPLPCHEFEKYFANLPEFNQNDAQTQSLIQRPNPPTQVEPA
ncbi:EAL domain-containing protein [Pelagibaculum spongiae]|uniref:cyclic-guanylate-specific phosphodiesterase n=1 Tax=Pelagibaculum spongiae TaxID=2080658 RepID=A0A2V1GUA3_9GAMM|nr:EAL domain-containing protein [Pelagibaculum spongiae]PVZ68237.1 hypothetical protein DC094_13145 [Pelagibaculum spongiae]